MTDKRVEKTSDILFCQHHGPHRASWKKIKNKKGKENKQRPRKQGCNANDSRLKGEDGARRGTLKRRYRNQKRRRMLAGTGMRELDNTR
jgi:hypothetical protein